MDTPLPPYMAYPRFLLGMELNETARLVYVLLLDRARLSRKNGWMDEQGKVYQFYPIQELAKDCHKSEMTIKTALSDLQKSGLIRRQRQGGHGASKIYIRVPGGQTVFCPPDGQNSIPATDRKLSASNKKKNNQPSRIYECEKGESL